jgi:hypothetical protein
MGMLWCCYFLLVNSRHADIVERIRGGWRAGDMLRETRIEQRLDIGERTEEAKGTTGLIPTLPLQRND